jgi:oligopeptide transport system substrate-binding protein
MPREHSPPQVEATSARGYPQAVRAFPVVVVLLSLATMACGPPRAALTVANGPDLETLDPQLARSSAALRASRAMFAGLTRLDPATLETVPDLAGSWDSPDGGRSWRFTLREGLRWSDGSPLTAADVVASWERLAAPATAAPYAAWVAGGRFQVEDGRPVAVFPEPRPLFPMLCSPPALAPVPTSLREQPPGVLPRPLVSSGPYRLLERRLRDRLRLERNPHSWRAAEVKSPTLDLLTVDSDITALNLFLTGQVAFAPKTPELALPTLLAEEDPRLHRGPELGTVFLRLNQAEGPAADPRLRRALLLATDPIALARTLGEGRQPAAGFVPPAMPGHGGASWPTPDPAAARALLAEVVAAGDGSPPRLELLYPSSTRNRLVAEALAAQWRETLGLELRLMNLEARTFYPAQSALEYQLSLSSWVADYPDALSFLEILRGGDRNNRSGYADPAYDRLIAEAATTLDPARRAALLGETEARLAAQAVVIPLLAQERQELVSTRLRGWHDNPLGVIDWTALELAPKP